MPRISNDLLLGLVFGYFLQNFFIIFLLGTVGGFLLQERYGSVKTTIETAIQGARDNTTALYNQYIRRGPKEEVEVPTKEPLKKED